MFVIFHEAQCEHEKWDLGAPVGEEGHKGSAAIALQGKGVKGFVVRVGMPGLSMLRIPVQLLL